jgi:hypothetical protein
MAEGRDPSRDMRHELAKWRTSREGKKNRDTARAGSTRDGQQGRLRARGKGAARAVEERPGREKLRVQGNLMARHVARRLQGASRRPPWESWKEHRPWR